MSAVRPDQFPREELPEIAFLGRSNVGKSSLLNALTGKKGLARTSSTPGRTQAINFFRIQDQWCFVDLPGYGYAKVPKAVQQSWKSLAESYLGRRRNLVLSCLLLDARHGWKEKDLELRQWLEALGRRFLVIATKFDKLNQKERLRMLAAIQQNCSGAPPVPFSAVTGQGVREIWQAISKTNQ
jgi:GTP-binding protein